jgi:hypothetical protein
VSPSNVTRSDASAQTQAGSLTERLEAATANLRELEQAVKSGDLDTRVLQEFRNAVDHIRGTSWAVQQWIGLRAQSGDPYELLPTLSAERVRRGTTLLKDLLLDVSSGEVGIETPGLDKLYSVVVDLEQRLKALLKRQGA